MTDDQPTKNHLVTRREMLGTTGVAAVTGLSSSVAGAVAQTPQRRPRIACCVSFWGGPGSHADWIICKLMDSSKCAIAHPEMNSHSRVQLVSMNSAHCTSSFPISWAG